MSPSQPQYCLDANVLIQAWQKYYSPTLCPSYWDVLNQLGAAGRICLPAHVRDEITRTEDDLAAWVKTSSIPIQPITENIGRAVSSIYAADPTHMLLVARGRSQADPWVIASAMSLNACVVTKEELITEPTSKKIKIPNVCQNMGVRCINDFDFLREVSAVFSCSY